MVGKCSNPRAEGYQGMWKRVPIGRCSFISPYNFPLNFAAHKIAPANAMGCPFVMKPASKTPLGAIIMGEVLAECDVLPEGAFSILPAHREGADPRQHALWRREGFRPRPRRRALCHGRHERNPQSGGAAEIEAMRW